MRAVKVGTPGQAVWVDQAAPSLQPGDLLLSPLACGICSSDIKSVRRGHQGPNPWALGHELVARVVQSDNPDHPAGQRVVVAPYLPCGECHFCLRGQPTLCERLFDNTPDPGGLAELVRVPAALARRGLLPAPDNLSSDVAALAEPLACCVHAAEACGIQAGDTVLVVGDGPMGLLNAAVARTCGAAQVIVSGMTPARLTLASQTYADRVIDVRQENLAQEVKGVTEGRGADAVIVAVSSASAAESGLSALRRGGAFNMFAGTSEGTGMSLDLKKLHYDEWRLTGSFGAAPTHLQKAIDLLSAGSVDVAPLITGRFPFERSLDAVDHMMGLIGMKAVVLFE